MTHRIAHTFLLFVGGLGTLSAQTTVSDTLYDAAGNKASGVVFITPSQTFTTVAGKVILPVQITATVTNGALSVALYPNDTSTPAGTYYTVKYALRNATATTEYWTVPTSGSPVALSAVRTTTIGTSSTVLLSQVSQGTAGAVTLSGGNGTKSFTVPYSGAPICVCTDTTAANAVKCSTSTTTLTVAGTGTDVIAYLCFAAP